MECFRVGLDYFISPLPLLKQMITRTAESKSNVDLGKKRECFDN